MATGSLKKSGWKSIGNSLPFQIPSGYTEVYVYGQIKVGPATGYRLGAMLPANSGGTVRQDTGYYASTSNYAVWGIIIESSGNILATTPLICGTAYDYTDAFSYINIMAR